ncbi:cobalamin biosynthesis protein CobD, partial [Kineosphaera limosa NBRC 100340]
PNAGPVEASAAGALGIRLGGVNRYEGHVEDRGELGDGRPATVSDLPRVARLSRIVGAAALAASVVVALGGRRG